MERWASLFSGTGIIHSVAKCALLLLCESFVLLGEPFVLLGEPLGGLPRAGYVRLVCDCCALPEVCLSSNWGRSGT